MQSNRTCHRASACRNARILGDFHAVTAEKPAMESIGRTLALGVTVTQAAG
jgi:hypothetical protein